MVSEVCVLTVLWDHHSAWSRGSRPPRVIGDVEIAYLQSTIVSCLIHALVIRALSALGHWESTLSLALVLSGRDHQLKETRGPRSWQFCQHV